MWRKLLQYGISGKFIRMIYNLYSDIKSCVSGDNNILSPFFESKKGVRQGENLSPVMFAIFLNDLASYLLNLNNTGVEISVRNEQNLVTYLKILALLYADDTALLSETETDLQKMIDDFDNYCSTFDLKVNIDKTKVVVFGTNRPTRYNFKIGENIIETVTKYKYLGVFFSSSGSFLNAKKDI